MHIKQKQAYAFGLYFVALAISACGDSSPGLKQSVQDDMSSAIILDMSTVQGDSGLLIQDMKSNSLPDMSSEPDMPKISDAFIVQDDSLGVDAFSIDMPALDMSTDPLPGFGALTGSCGVLMPENLKSPAPSTFVNNIDFGDTPFMDSLKQDLTQGGMRLLDAPNAGGSSKLSEVFSYEVMARCEMATLLKTELEVLYDQAKPGSVTDYLVDVDGLKIGVSVVRAFVFNQNMSFTEQEASRLMEKKLEGILSSSSRVQDADRWEKQILHVMVDKQEFLEPLNRVLNEQIASSLRSDTVIVLTVTDGDDSFIYINPK